MIFFDSLKKVVRVFYNSGIQKFYIVLLVSFISMIIEICSLYILYLVIKNLLQSKEIIETGIAGISVSMQNAIIILTIAYLIKFLFSVFNSRYQINFCFETNRKITSQLVKYYYSLNLETFKSGKISDALNKIFTIGGFFSELILQSVIIFFTECSLSIIIIISLLFFNFKILLLLLMVLMPISLFLVYKSRKKLNNTGKEHMQENVEYHQVVNTLIGGIFDIKLSGRFVHFFNDFTKKISKLHNTKKIIFLESSFPAKVFEFVIILGIAILFFVSVHFGKYSEISGLVAAFATASFRFVPSVNRMISSIHNINIYKNYISFIDETFKHEYKPEDDFDNSTESLQTIELKNINFSYKENKVLNDFSLKLNNKEITGITGSSGMGKTTLINIISGLLKPASGNILINEKHLNSFNKGFLFHKSAYVMQESFFFYGTIVDNIAFGIEPIDIEKIKWCIEAVKMKEWLTTQKDGINTIIGDSGTTISGGQKQRLAIARGLYRNANLLILDEPSSSLDFENKSEIISLIKEITKKENLITIIVTHDNDILGICDKIIKL